MANSDLGRIHELCRRGQTSAVMDTLKKMPNLINETDAQENSALHYAAQGGHADCVRQLIAVGAPIKALPKKGETALHLAVWRDHPDCVQLMVDNGADKSIRDSAGKTARELARSEVVRKLLPDFSASEIANVIQVAGSSSDDYSDDDE
eukprot:241202_1